jgi:D-arabinose 1-dehydrogenase-like Zn-dependent alcohol dehydrogenase
MNRRTFLQSSGSGFITANLIAPAASLRGMSFDNQKRRRVGLIGCGWYGKIDLFRLIQVSPVEVIALCDVDRRMLAEAAGMVAARQASRKTPRTYSRYGDMLKERDLDIVLIAPPDHWHALIMIEAVQSGADVYVQKPISVDVEEGRAMLAAARRHGRVVQVGLQRTPLSHEKFACSNRQRRQAGIGYRGRLHLDRILHFGQQLAVAWPIAEVGCAAAGNRGRCGG